MAMITRLFATKEAAERDHNKEYTEIYCNSLYSLREQREELIYHPWGYFPPLKCWASVSYYSKFWGDFADIMQEEAMEQKEKEMIGVLDFNVFDPSMNLDI